MPHPERLGRGESWQIRTRRVWQQIPFQAEPRCRSPRLGPSGLARRRGPGQASFDLLLGPVTGPPLARAIHASVIATPGSLTGGDFPNIANLAKTSGLLLGTLTFVVQYTFMADEFVPSPRPPSLPAGRLPQALS